MLLVALGLFGLALGIRTLVPRSRVGDCTNVSPLQIAASNDY
jgi:hypothetical protein